MKGTLISDGGNLCPLWLVILKSVGRSIRDTLHYSWPCFARLLCLETDWNILVEKLGYVFILTDFKK